MTQQSAYIVSFARTPIGSFNGSLANLNAVELGAKAVEAALQRAGISPEEVEEFYFGNVLSANLGQNPARQIALKANIPQSVSATTLNKVCASGLKAVEFGAKSIMLGLADVVVVGGTESMTNAPHYLPSARSGIRYGDSKIVDSLSRDGLSDAYDNCAMGIFADETAEEHSISREQQDEFAISSYQRAIDATSQGLLKDEIIPIEVPQGRKLPPVTVDKDEEISRFNPEKLKKLNPAFNTNGAVTAGNASSINDGSAALVLVSQAKLEQLKLHENVFKIVSFADGAQRPQRFTTAPSIAIPKALSRAGLDVNQIDYYEINEAFSAVALANSKILNLSQDKVNVFGGAVGIGHPLGCSGARILVTLCNVLNKKDGRLGCAAVCNGGGGASSLIIEKVKDGLNSAV